MGRVIPFVASVLVSRVAQRDRARSRRVQRDRRAVREIIAYARVVDVRPEWAEGGGWIDSVVTAEVVSLHEGRLGRTVQFKVPGGRLGRYRSVIVGAPVFARGDEAVLFLKSHADGLPDVFGLNQGVFRVKVDSANRAANGRAAAVDGEP